MAVEQGGKTGWELRQIVPGADLVRERDDMRRYFYLTGLGLLDQLRSIQLAQAPIDLEGAAMANLYTADWHLLFNEEDAALTAYKRSYEELSYAGRQSDELDQFFATPSVLPVHDFHSSLTAASTFGQGVEVEQSELDSFRQPEPAAKTDHAQLLLRSGGLAFHTPVHLTQ